MINPVPRSRGTGFNYYIGFKRICQIIYPDASNINITLGVIQKPSVYKASGDQGVAVSLNILLYVL